MADKTKVILAYINFPDGTTIHLDREFASLTEVEQFVTLHHDGFSSYGVTVLSV